MRLLHNCPIGPGVATPSRYLASCRSGRQLDRELFRFYDLQREVPQSRDTFFGDIGVLEIKLLQVAKHPQMHEAIVGYVRGIQIENL